MRISTNYSGQLQIMKLILHYRINAIKYLYRTIGNSDPHLIVTKLDPYVIQLWVFDILIACVKYYEKKFNIPTQ